MKAYSNFLSTVRLDPTCCITDVQMHHIFLVQEEGAEVDTAGCQHSFVGLEVHSIHNKGAVAQQALLTLPVKLLQNLPTVPWELHCSGGLRMVEDAGRQAQALWTTDKSHVAH